MAELPPPIPQRIPPLAWRAPALVWTPLALALAIGWPALLFMGQPELQRLMLIAGAAVFALALAALGIGWALGRAPKARRIVVAHVLIAGAAAAFIAPFALAAYAGSPLTLSWALAMTPLALVLGLPISLISGIVFAWIALRPLGPPKPKKPDPVSRYDVQPFR